MSYCNVLHAKDVLKQPIVNVVYHMQILLCYPTAECACNLNMNVHTKRIKQNHENDEKLVEVTLKKSNRVIKMLLLLLFVIHTMIVVFICISMIEL